MAFGKYIRPHGLYSDRKSTKLVKNNNFISEEEYEINKVIIEEILGELNSHNLEVEEGLENRIKEFNEQGDEISNIIDRISSNMDNILNSEDYDINQVKARVRDYIKEKYEILYDLAGIKVSERKKNDYVRKAISKFEEFESEKTPGFIYKNIYKTDNPVDLIFEEGSEFNDITSRNFVLKNINNESKVFIYDRNGSYNLLNVIKEPYQSDLNDYMNKIDDFMNNPENYGIDLSHLDRYKSEERGENALFYYNNKTGIQIVKYTPNELVENISFDYKCETANIKNNGVYFYIDGILNNILCNNTTTNIEINEINEAPLKDKIHEYSWILYSEDDQYFASIDNIKIKATGSRNLEYVTNKEFFDVKYEDGVPLNVNKFKGSDIYYTYKNLKVLSVKKTCSEFSFYYKIENKNVTSTLYYIEFYIDGFHYTTFYKSNNYEWQKITIENLFDEEHEFTWLLYSDDLYHGVFISKYGIDEEIKEIYTRPLNKISSGNRNESRPSIPFYIPNSSEYGSAIRDSYKVVSIKKQCTSVSFFIRGSYSSNFHFFIDGFYVPYGIITNQNNNYKIENLSYEEHEFTWIICKPYNSNSGYVVLDTIAFDDVVEKDESLFSDTYTKELKYIVYNNQIDNNSPIFSTENNNYRVVSIKKRCTSVSFYANNYYIMIANDKSLYVDGINRDSDIQLDSNGNKILENLSDEEHEFTWIIYGEYNYIWSIAFDDVVEKDESLFSDTYTKELKPYNKQDGYPHITNQYKTFFHVYKNDPFKIVSIKKRCTSMSFWYITSFDKGLVFLYIDGIRNKFADNVYNRQWKQIEINDLTDEEHEFTWIFPKVSYSGANENTFYTGIDTIAFDGIVETDTSLFTGTFSKELKNNYDVVNNYDFNTNGVQFLCCKSENKIISIKKRCTAVKFRSSINYNTNSKRGYILFFIDGIPCLETEKNNLSDEEHEFTWIMSGNYLNYTYIDTIRFDDVVEKDESLFSDTYTKELKTNFGGTENFNKNYYNYFYISNNGVKIISIKKRCTSMSFNYGNKNISSSGSNSTTYIKIYLYIDGKYKKDYDAYYQVMENREINDLTDEEHEFTWILHYFNQQVPEGMKLYIYNIAFDGVVEADTSLFTGTFSKELKDNYVKNDDYLFRSNRNITGSRINIDVKSIKRRCTSMMFSYQISISSYYYLQSPMGIYLYIDGNFYKKYYITKTNMSSSIFADSANDLTDEEHEFTWILYSLNSSNTNNSVTIKGIAFDNVYEDNASLFSNTYTKELDINNIITENNELFINGDESSIPFYLKPDENKIKVVSIKKRCTSMSFYYKLKGNDASYILLYIDGIPRKILTSSLDWKQEEINLSDEEHEITWVLFSFYDKYQDNDYYTESYSAIDTIAFDGVVETDASLFKGLFTTELKILDEQYVNKNVLKPATSLFYVNNNDKCKIVSIKKRCTSMSFWWFVSHQYSFMYFYIDGIYQNLYPRSTWTKEEFNDLSDEEHEFTWILVFGYLNTTAIDTIAFDGVVETDIGLFRGISENNFLIDSYVKNGNKTSTPFYCGFRECKVVSIKKRCTSMSFYSGPGTSYIYDDYSNIKLFIDGKLKKQINSLYSWIQTEINDLTDEEHEFTWILRCYANNQMSIDTIAFDGVVETDASLFNGTFTKKIGIDYLLYVEKDTLCYNKVISIKKRCTSIDFYKATSTSNDSISFFIDGINRDSDLEYISNNNYKIKNLSDEEHEFTWIMIHPKELNYNFDSITYLDKIAFDGIVETDYSLFSNLYTKELTADTINYKFAINKLGYKIVSIKKQCTKIKIPCTLSSTNGKIILFIDGNIVQEIIYTGGTNQQSGYLYADELEDKEHEITVLMCSTSQKNYYSSSGIKFPFLQIDYFIFDDIIEKNEELYTNIYTKGLRYISDKYRHENNKISTPFFKTESVQYPSGGGWNNFTTIKIVSIKKRCTSMSYWYKTSYNKKGLSLYIDGIFEYESGVANQNTQMEWEQKEITNLSDEEHEFTWLMNSTADKIDTIAFDGVVETDASLFKVGIFTHKLDNTPDIYKNGINTSTPFYISLPTSLTLIVSIKKRCTSMSFYHNYINKYYNTKLLYFYIDGTEKELMYDNLNEWMQESINDLSDEEHEFTWIMNTNASNVKVSIDTIAFDGVVETDASLFRYKYDIPLKNPWFSNNNIETTPHEYVNGNNGIKIVSFLYQNENDENLLNFHYNSNGGIILLYINGKYIKTYYSSIGWNDIIEDEQIINGDEITFVLIKENSDYGWVGINYDNKLTKLENIMCGIKDNKIAKICDKDNGIINYYDKELDYRIFDPYEKNIILDKINSIEYSDNYHNNGIIEFNKIYICDSKFLTNINDIYKDSITNNTIFVTLDNNDDNELKYFTSLNSLFEYYKNRDLEPAVFVALSVYEKGEVFKIEKDSDQKNNFNGFRSRYLDDIYYDISVNNRIEVNKVKKYKK